MRTEQSFRLQSIAAALVIVVMLVVQVTFMEAVLLFLLIGSVLILELINSIFERLVDVFKPRIHPIVKEIKDIMAATVLIASITALVIGCLILVPYFI